MFVTNYSSLPSNVVWVSKKMKDYLESKGFCVLSYKNDKYAFTESDDLLNILSQKGGEDE